MVDYRPDISKYVAHFTSSKWPKGYKDESNPTNIYKAKNAYSRLISILENKTIFASQLPWVGNSRAVCFTECPWTSLIGHTKEYSSYGLGFTKEFIFSKGGGPAYYVRADVFNLQQWSDEIKPFVTPFMPEYATKEVKNASRVKKCDYTHEREWRIKSDLNFEYSDIAFVVLPDYATMAKFPQDLKDAIGRNKFLLMDNYRMIESLWPVHIISGK